MVTKTDEAAAATEAAAADAPKEGESKRDAFVRIYERRMNNVLKGIRLLEAMTNKANYEFTEADWNAGFAAIEAHMGKVSDLLAGKPSAQGGFSLGGTAAPTAE